MARIEPQDPEQALAKEESYAKLLLGLLRKVMTAAARALGFDTDPAVSTATINVPAGSDPIPAPTQEAMAQEDISIIPALWTAQAAAVLIPELSAVYEGTAGHMLAGMANAFPDLSVIPQVSDEFAEQRLAGAHNRLIGIGDMLWESARAQLSEGFALGEGFDKLRDRVQAAAGVTAARAERIARCLPPETPISGAVVRAVTRRWYEGPMVILVMESGRELTATPNHPMFTHGGWRPAGEIGQGDYLVCDRRDDYSGPAGNEYVAQPPATIAEVFEAARAVGILERRTAAEPDFHGDGRDGDVDIARSGGELKIGRFSPLYKHSVDGILPFADPSRASFCADCGRLLSVDKQACLCRGSGTNSGILEHSVDGFPGNPKALRYTAYRLATEESLSDALPVKVGPFVRGASTVRVEVLSRLGQGAGLMASAAQLVQHGRRVDPQAKRHLVRAEPRQIESDRVVGVRYTGYCGHVYNLHTAYGYFSANTFYTGNTEVIAASNAGAIDQVRFAGLVGTKTWLATPDERTRCTHHKADGQTVNLDDKFTLGGFGPDADPGCADVGVSYADYPGDPELPASEAVSCRCTLIFDVEPGTLLAAAANMNDQQLSDQQVDDYADPNPIGGARMPWHIVEDSAQCPAARPFAVVKDATGEVEGCHPTRGAATEQLDALYAAEQRMHTIPAEQAAMECPEGHHRMPDGSCMPDEQMPTQNPGYAAVQRWEGTLAIEGVETGDGRMFSVDSLTWRDLPVPLMYQKVTSHGGVDDVTVNVGAIDEIWRDGNLIWGRGRIDMEDPNGVEVARKMRHGYLRGVSIDADSIKDADVEFVWPGGAAPSDELDIMQLMGAAPELTIYNRGRISAATVVNIPAFAEASLMLVDADTGALVAAGAEALPEELDKVTPEITPTSGPTAEAFSFAAVRSHESATSGDSWDAATEERRLPSPMTVTAGRQFYAWIDDAEVSDGHMPKAAGKFGHHMVNADGRPGAANLAACSAGIGSLHGARNEPDIPEKDLRGVYNHLRQHLIDGGRDPDSIPEFGAAPLTASSYVIEIPDLPPAHFFEEPAELPPIGAMWVTAQGRLFGLVGPGDTAHRSFSDRRVTIPMGNVDYNAWMNRPTLVQGGKRVATGVITMNCGHASPLGPRDPAERMRHYDDSCSIAAVVAVGESKRFNAPWVSGVLMPMDAEQVQRFMACQLSGDWAPHRERPGWREFVAALAVPVPGFARATTARVVDDVLVSSAVPILPWRDLQPQPNNGPLPDSHRHQLDRMRNRFGLSNRAQIGAIMERLRAGGGSPRAPRPPVAGDGEDKEGHGAASTRVVFHLPGKHPQENHGRRKKSTVAVSGFAELTAAQAQAMQERMISDKPWGPRERVSLNKYTENHYMDINLRLQGKGPDWAIDDEAYRRAPETIRDIRRAMRPLPEDVKVYRVAGWRGLGTDHMDPRPLQDFVGTIMQNAGFTSTTIQKDAVVGGDVFLEIEVPAGTPAAYVESVSYRPEERELLLDAGQKLEFTGIGETFNGMPTLKARVVP